MTADPPVKPRDRTPAEQAALDRVRAQERKCPSVQFSRADDGALKMQVTCEDEGAGFAVLMNAVGAGDVDFFAPFMLQLVNATIKDGEVQDEAANFMLSVVKGIEPRDQMEAMLAAQMAAIHIATLNFARKLNHVETLQQQDGAEKALNKLARTFATQMETLKRYRTGGEQKVTVQHVTVNEGGQAVVGNVERGGGA